MTRFVFVSLLFMGWAFYELSGGNDFVPPSQSGMIAAAEAAEPAAAAPDPEASAASADQPEVATRAAIDPSVGDLSIAVVTRKAVSDASPVAEPAVADRNIGQGNLKIVSLDMPASDDALSATAERPDEVDTARVIDRREVTGTRVNMRNGPGTEYSILSRLDRGDQVEILQEPGNGWVKLRVTGTGRVGWMADFLLASVN